MPGTTRLAVIGGGWAGLAAAVEATKRGHRITLYEMAQQLGGRARQVEVNGVAVDNGQHILIGAYSHTLAVMKEVGVDIEQAFMRTPLQLTYPGGAGLRLPGGPPILAFARAVWSYPGWRWREKCQLLAAAGGWLQRGFACRPEMTVSQLTARLAPRVREELLEPLCVAALNTPASKASASVFLRVLKDALFSGPGSADLLLPRRRLSALWPDPAARWLEQRGASIRLSRRVERVEPDGAGWRVDGEPADGVVLACTAVEAARLAAPLEPAWARLAAGLDYEPIVTVYARSENGRLPEPMLALHSHETAPAQFVFDLGRLGGPDGLFAFVISGAGPWVERGSDATVAITLRQGQTALGTLLVSPLEPLRALTEKRATFQCTPNLQRPPPIIRPRLVAAGDYVAGPYPATLEGAVRSGQSAANACSGT